MRWFPAGGGRALLRGSGAAALLAGWACGGGGGGGGAVVIPPFRVWGQVVVADLDGDGRPDVAVPSTLIEDGRHQGGLQVFLRNPAVGFAAPVSHALGFDPWGLCVGDLDGDGRPDLIATIPATAPPKLNTPGDSGGLMVFRQDPAAPGRFLAPVWAWTGGAAETAAVGDWTGDGLADVAVADGVFVHSRILLMAQAPGSPGTLLPPLPLPVGTGHGFRGMAAADLNGDGRPDLALAGYDCLAVLHQQPGGGFAAPVFPSLGMKVEGVAAADLDGDGRTDLVAVNPGHAADGDRGQASVTVFLQAQPGTFTATSVPLAEGARRVAIGDLNGDGLPDLAVISLVYQALSTPSRVTVLLQSAVQRGTFSVASVQDGTWNADTLALGDLDGDGRTDLVLNEGPSLMLQTAPGVFSPPQPLR